MGSDCWCPAVSLTPPPLPSTALFRNTTRHFSLKCSAFGKVCGRHTPSVYGAFLEHFFLTVDVSWTQGGGKVGGGVGGRALASQETKGNNLCAGHHRHAEDVGRAALRPHRGEPDGAADGPPPPGAVLTHGWGGGAEQETGAGQPLDEFGGVCILHFAFCSVHLHLERLSMVIVFTTNKCQ